MPSSTKAAFFYQRPFTANSEQIGCYYFNILQAVELCRAMECAIVPPNFPLCPRDNSMVEVYKNEHWEKSILTIDSISSAELLEYSIPTLSLGEFAEASGKRVNMSFLSLEYRGILFIQDPESHYKILDMPGRWDLQGHDPNLLYMKLYKTLPFKRPKIPLATTSLEDILSMNCLGVHWRRGDRGNITMGEIGKRLWKSTEPDQVAKCINILLEKNPKIELVYISTNSGSTYDRETLELLVKAPIYFLYRPRSTNPLEHWKWDLTDLFLCSKASHLLLSPGGQNSSAFGRLIYAEALRGSSVQVSHMPLL
jgi:hypothetical protein